MDKNEKLKDPQVVKRTIDDMRQNDEELSDGDNDSEERDSKKKRMSDLSSKSIEAILLSRTLDSQERQSWGNLMDTVTTSLDSFANSLDSFTTSFTDSMIQYAKNMQDNTVAMEQVLCQQNRCLEQVTQLVQNVNLNFALQNKIPIVPLHPTSKNKVPIVPLHPTSENTK